MAEKLNVDTVRNIFSDCLLGDPNTYEPDTEVTPVYAITGAFVFDPVKLEEHADEIRELLDELPETFHEKTGGGWSFLQATYDKHGNHWGEHDDMEELFSLGEGAGYVNALFPRDMWSSLPGGVPYYIINTERRPIKTRPLKEIHNRTYFSAE